MLRDVSDVLPAYIISTSYTQYIMAVCDVIGFPLMNTFSTSVNLDHYPLKDSEKKTLKDLHARILTLPDFIIPRGKIRGRFIRWG